MRIPEYDRLDATALAALVATGQVSPPELLEAAIERADARNPRLNAIVRRHDAEARRRAAGTLPEGPFRGVPFLIKDLLAFRAGWPVTSSSRLLQGVIAPFDSELVKRMERAGLVLFGQTNTPEFGILPVTESDLRGPCRNPWNLDHTPGGSSGGSAAAVAARIVPMAHGNDGGGSLRIPASCCALFGLKPTRGRVSFAPAFGEVWSGFVQEHVLTRTVRDSAAMLDVLSGNLNGDPYWAPPVARPFRQEVGAKPGKLRIAFTTGPLFGRTVHPDCVAAVESAARLLADLGHEVVEARPAFSRDELVWAYLVITGANLRAEIEMARRARGLRRVPRPELEPQTWALATAGHVLSADELAQAQVLVERAGRVTAGFLEEHDLFLTATLAQPPLPVGSLRLKPGEQLGLRVVSALRHRRLIERLLREIAEHGFEATGNTMLFNETGQPAMSVPLHWNAAGLPIGVQFAARFGDEATLFRLAAQLEEARPWAGRVPPAFA